MFKLPRVDPSDTKRWLMEYLTYVLPPTFLTFLLFGAITFLLQSIDGRIILNYARNLITKHGESKACKQKGKEYAYG